MTLLYDVVDLAQVTGAARKTFDQEAQRNQWQLLDVLLPIVTTEDTELEEVLGSLPDEDEAKIRAWDTESEIRGRQGISKAKFELPPISLKYQLGEKETLDQVRLGRASGTAKVIVNAIYADANRGARAIAARWARLRADALFNGSISLTETTDRVIQSISYGRAGGHTVTASILWTVANKATATPITDLQTWVQTFITTNGFGPAAIVTSSKVVSMLLQMDQIKAVLQLPSGAPAAVTEPALAGVLEAYGLPPIIRFDANTRRAGSVTRLTTDTKLLMVSSLSDPIGNFYSGPTAESLALVRAQQISGDQAPGLAVVVDETTDPVSKWTKVAGVGLPWVPQPNYTFLATVTS